MVTVLSGTSNKSEIEVAAVNGPHGPRVRSGVVWFRSKCDGPHILANRYFRMPPIARPASTADIDLLSLCDGAHDVKRLAKVLGRSEQEVSAELERWEHAAPGMFAWPHRANADRRFNSRLDQAFRMVGQWQAANAPRSENDVFHKEGIENALVQFESIETTVSHAFQDSHPALAGRSYSEAFCDALLNGGAFKHGARITEIGGGVGYFASGFLGRLLERNPVLYASVTYTILDLSPTLQESQRNVCSAHRDRMAFRLGDVATVDLPPACADLIIANEMIADLPIGTVASNKSSTSSVDENADRLATKYGLLGPELHSSFAINVGAIHLLERLSDWLAPDATAILTEYGHLERVPSVVKLGAHDEYTIHFGHLRDVAGALSLSPRVDNLGEFLGADGDYPVVRSSTLQMLRRHLLPALGVDDLPARTYDLASLQACLTTLAGNGTIENIKTNDLRRDGWMTPFDFYALRVRAPA